MAWHMAKNIKNVSNETHLFTFQNVLVINQQFVYISKRFHMYIMYNMMKLGQYKRIKDSLHDEISTK